MDGLGRVAGALAAFAFAEGTWPVAPLRLKHWGEFENYLLFNRPQNPLREVQRVAAAGSMEIAEKLTKRVRRDLRANKGDRVARPSEVMNWINTVEGITYSLWCCLRESGNPAWTTLEGVADSLALLSAQRIGDLVRLRDQLSGTDLYADADWPDPLSGVRESKIKERLERAEKEFTPWRKLFYLLGQNCGFDANQVGEWTLYQWRLYTSSPEIYGIKNDTAPA